MNHTVITTPRLAMRLWRDEDEGLLPTVRTPAVMRWLKDDDMPERRPGPFSVRAQALQAEYGHCFWVVERREDSAFLGYCGLKRVDADGTTLTGAFEIGWTFAEAYWGHGYATEAATAALARAFAVHEAPYVVAFTVAGNVPSWRVMERIGMERRPELDFHDPAYSDRLNPTIVYTIDRAQWSAAT